MDKSEFHRLPGLAEALAAFGLLEKAAALFPHGDGHINDTYALRMQGEGQPRYVVQRLNTHVFPDPAAVMANIAAVTSFLRGGITAAGGDAQRECLWYLPAADGRLYHTAADGSVWRCCLYISGSVSHTGQPTPRQLALCGQVFGGFLRQLDGFDAASLQEIIPRFHHTENRLANLIQAAQADPLGRRSEVEDELAFALARRADCSRLTGALAKGEVPLRVTHNDTKLANILFDEATGAPLCVVDLDTVMPGLAAYDFGEATRTGAATAPEDQVDGMGLDLSLYESFAKGYITAAQAVLTPAEVASLPWGSRLMTLENGLRFLTDYLQGDTYYKIDHPRHNLYRCQAQFRLVAHMEKHFGQMQAIVAKYAGAAPRQM